MNELELKLEYMISSLEELSNVLNKSISNSEDVSKTMLSKNIEDGILDNIQFANKHQLNHIINSYCFRFYTEFNTDKELLKREITRRIRDNNLEKILS
jgi:3-dehydroquinate dehydratase